MLQRFKVVLVEPIDNLNIGSVARAMDNLGFTNLVLVKPAGFKPEKAAVSACWAVKILESALVVETLDQALEGINFAVGFSARAGKNRRPTSLLPDWGSEVNKGQGSTALIFGPEDSGLRSEHLERCSSIVRIPSNPSNPAFNLAQAVLLALFEIVRSSTSQFSGAKADEFASAQDFLQLDKILDSVVLESGFIHESSPHALPGLLRAMLRRIEPDKREMGILMGLFGRLERILRGEVPLPARRS